VGFIWAILSVAVLYGLQGVILRVFSSDPDVNALILSVYLLIAIFVFFDCLQGVTSGIIRGLGQQGLASCITLVGYWLIGIPLSLIAVYKLGWGMQGLWLGPTAAIIFNFVFYILFVLRCDWD